MPATEPAGPGRASGAVAAGDHPLAALRGFRMEVGLVEPRRGGCVRDLGCFLAGYVLVVGFVLALIEGYLALTARV